MWAKSLNWQYMNSSTSSLYGLTRPGNLWWSVLKWSVQKQVSDEFELPMHRIAHSFENHGLRVIEVWSFEQCWKCPKLVGFLSTPLPLVFYLSGCVLCRTFIIAVNPLTTWHVLPIIVMTQPFEQSFFTFSDKLVLALNTCASWPILLIHWASEYGVCQNC